MRILSLLALLAHGASAFSSSDVYDVVVVGSGPGGLVAAEFLSRDASVSVLILEAGPPSLAATGGTTGPAYATSKGWTQFDVPGEFDNTIYNDANEQFHVDWVHGPSMWLGKLVGGCSSLNAALYFRPPDRYVTTASWPFTPARVAALMTENEQLHGVTDVPSTDGKRYNQEGYTIVARALESLGYAEKPLADATVARDASQTKRYGHAPFAIQDGLRDAPAKTFWRQMKDRANVKLVTSALVSHIVHSQGKATGVVYNGGTQVQLSPRGAVVMAAGALSTPKVLIQSGIGPSDQLEMLRARGAATFPGVGATSSEWVANDNVGKSLFDTNVVFASFSHKDMKSFQYKTRPPAAIDQFVAKNQSGPWASPGPVLVGYETYDVNGRAYEFQTTVLTAGFGDFYAAKDAFTTSLYINNPEARDAVAFRADGSWHAFTADSAYLGTRNDLAAMQSYATRVVGALTKAGATFLSAANGQSVADWVSANKGLITHHFGGTCYTSSDASDPKRCADDKLRVQGTSNVFIGDASAMRDGTVNPYGFVMYIGREAGEQVRTFLSSGASGATSSSSSRNTTDNSSGHSSGNSSATSSGTLTRSTHVVAWIVAVTATALWSIV